MSSPLVVGVHIDDLLSAGPMDDDIDTFKLEMHDRFWMSDLGLLSYYMGIEGHQESNDISLYQRGYARSSRKGWGWKTATQRPK
jgi:hypothetical protein